MNNYYDLYKKNLKYLTILNTIIKFIDIPINLIIANFIANIINGATNSNLKFVIKNSTILISIIIANIIITYFLKYFYETQKNKITNQLKLMLYTEFLNQKMSTLYLFKQEELIEVFNKDFSSLIELASIYKPNFYRGILGVIIYTVFLLTKSPIILITFIILSLIQVFVPIIITKFLVCNYEETWEIESLITSYIISSYKGFSLIKCYNLKNWILNNFKKLNERYLKVSMKSETIASLERILETATNNILTYGTYIIIGLFILYQKVDLNTAVKCISISSIFFYYVKSIFDIYPKLFVSKLAKDKIMKYFSFEENTDKNYIANNLNNQINFEKIDYSFENKTIFKNASININLDEITIIKGENGVGKSTFFKLLMGLIEQENGQIYINGNKNTNEIFVLYEVFYMPQEDINFEFSILELIKLMSYVDFDKVKEIALKFGLTYEKLTKSKICDLSGGERKKCFLSIALSLDNKFLLLDEPTNHLDKESKKILQQFLFSREKGSIIIIHNELFENIQNQYLLINGGFKNEKL